MYLFKLELSLDICPGVGLQDHMVTLLLGFYFLLFRKNFYGTSILISIEAIPIYIPTNSVGRLPFLHTISSIYYLLIF